MMVCMCERECVSVSKRVRSEGCGWKEVRRGGETALFWARARKGRRSRCEDVKSLHPDLSSYNRVSETRVVEIGSSDEEICEYMSSFTIKPAVPLSFFGDEEARIRFAA